MREKKRTTKKTNKNTHTQKHPNLRAGLKEPRPLAWAVLVFRVRLGAGCEVRAGGRL